VGRFLKRTDRDGSVARFTNVYIKNLPEDIDDDGLKVVAEEFGEVGHEQAPGSGGEGVVGHLGVGGRRCGGGRLAGAWQWL